MNESMLSMRVYTSEYVTKWLVVKWKKKCIQLVKRMPEERKVNLEIFFFYSCIIRVNDVVLWGSMVANLALGVNLAIETPEWVSDYHSE